MASHGDDELAIKVSSVFKQYGRGRQAQKVLKGINMDVPYYNIYALLGASGCGKTTLLRCCLGYLRQNSGTIMVLGKYPGSRGTKVPGRDVGYMPQDVGLAPQFSINEIMYFFGIMHNMGFKQIRQRATFLRNLLELPPLSKRICEMSGGEQRCVSFAVALLQEPPLLIMDEPTVGMDSLLRQKARGSTVLVTCSYGGDVSIKVMQGVFPNRERGYAGKLPCYEWISVWQYISEMTQAKQCTVIITTHYIDEARGANVVGLMRGGKLLTQSRPEDLIRAYNAVTLEEVFVKLAYKQIEDEEGLDPGSTVDVSRSIQADDRVPRVNFRRKISFLDAYIPRSLWSFHAAIVVAIALKATVKSIRNIGMMSSDVIISGILMSTCILIISYSSLLFMLLITVITAIGFIFFIGRNIRDVKLYYHSEDLKFENKIYGNVFIHNLETSNRFEAEQVSSIHEAIHKIKDGDAYFGVLIPKNFSERLYTRYSLRCNAIVNFFNGSEDSDFPSRALVDQSTIQVYVDATDAQLLNQGMMVLRDKGQIMLNEFLLDLFEASAYQLARPPVLLSKPVFGSMDWEYSDFIGSAILTAVVFLNSIALTAMAFIMERKEGVFERAYSAGASVTDFMFAYSLHAAVILMLHVVILLTVVFAIFEIEMEGNVFLYGLIVWLTSMLSAALGLLLSSQVTGELEVQNIAQLIAAICVFLCGALWPLNGQPIVLRWISKVIIPATWPSTAASAIGAKGLGLVDEPVYVGFIDAVAFIIVIYFLAIAFFRTE